MLGRMPVGRRRALIAAAAVAAAAGGVSLSGFTLTLPVDSAGRQSGAASTVSPAKITAPWLTRNADGSLTFFAPTKGAHTPNSPHPRTELVSTKDFDAGSGTHTMTATMVMQQLPSAQDIIIGQIHGGGPISAVPLLMLHYRHTSADAATSGRVTLTVRTNPAGFTVTATSGDRTGKQGVPLNASFKGKDVRFQVGDYQQTPADDSATDGGRLTLRALTAD
jgi:hypothetical protein